MDKEKSMILITFGLMLLIGFVVPMLISNQSGAQESRVENGARQFLSTEANTVAHFLTDKDNLEIIDRTEEQEEDKDIELDSGEESPETESPVNDSEGNGTNNPPPTQNPTPPVTNTPPPSSGGSTNNNNGSTNNSNNNNEDSDSHDEKPDNSDDDRDDDPEPNPAPVPDPDEEPVEDPVEDPEPKPDPEPEPDPESDDEEDGEDDDDNDSGLYQPPVTE